MSCYIVHCIFKYNESHRSYLYLLYSLCCAEFEWDGGYEKFRKFHSKKNILYSTRMIWSSWQCLIQSPKRNSMVLTIISFSDLRGKYCSACLKVLKQSIHGLFTFSKQYGFMLQMQRLERTIKLICYGF